MELGLPILLPYILALPSFIGVVLTILVDFSQCQKFPQGRDVFFVIHPNQS